MPDQEFDADEQDLAETFDETHREDEDPSGLDAAAGEDPDQDENVYDVTRAMGDGGLDDDDRDGEEDEGDFDDIEDLDEDEDDEDEDNDAELLADRPDDDFNPSVNASIRPEFDEPGLDQVEDIDTVTTPHHRDASKYESKGPLSDDQIRDLGYAPRVADEDRAIPKAHDENRLDEGLEETFPASDPVSASHIT